MVAWIIGKKGIFRKRTTPMIVINNKDRVRRLPILEADVREVWSFQNKQNTDSWLRKLLIIRRYVQ